VLGGQFTGAATVQHSDASSVVQLAAEERGAAGFAGASLVERVGGQSAGLQYGLTAQTSIGIGHGEVRLGARDQNDGIITVGIHGPAHDARFQVIIDDAVRGEIGGNQHITVAVTPYRRYKVRIRPLGAQLVAFDTQDRTIDVYPGTFAPLDWKVNAVLAMFGRLVGHDGNPIANADIVADGAIAATDDHGYFQLQAPSDTKLTAHGGNGLTCTAKLDAQRSAKGYTPLGDVRCTS
jgi:Mat/Ecp fimbriae outer membrane usher protein